MAEPHLPKITVPKLLQMKKKQERIVCLTAYDLFGGLIADQVADLILVGDSLGNTVLGYETTVPVTQQEIIHHLKAVRKGVTRSLLVADMPFGTYGASIEQAFDTATQLMKAGAQAVKLEGVYNEEIRCLWKAGIPVMGHLGMTPQSVHRFGGFKVQGRDNEQSFIDSAKEIEDSGAFAIVLELIPAALAEKVTAAIEIPTIGIGAGIHCDGEIQVFHDVLGLSDFKPKHAKQYVGGKELLADALKQYAEEVRTGKFPTSEQSS